MDNFEGSYSVVSRVLVVDDHRPDQDWFRQTLSAAGMTAEIAKDGGQAHAMFTMHKPDFVLLDLILPGESGYEVCQRFKQVEKTVPVLIVSEVELADSRRLAERVGADDYVTKPIAADALVTTIKEVGERVWRRYHLGEEPKSEERVRFSCSNCERRIKVKAAYRGRPLSCPECGHITVVPRVS